VRVTVGDERVKVVEVMPAAIALRVERLTTRTFTVQARFANEPPAGFQPGQPVFAPTEVRVGGPGSLVALVTAIFATVRYGDVGVDIIQSAQVQAVDAAGNAVEGVTVEPAGVQVNVPILPTASTRTVPVLWILRGSVAPGYWISRVSTDPVAVTVRGDPKVLGQLDRIETASVDVGGISSNRTFRTSLTLPDRVSLVQPGEATVTVVVTPLSGTRPFPLVAVQVTGAAAGLTADVDPKTVDIVVSGLLAQLNTLKPEDIVASVDASGRGAGTHALDVSLKLPPGFTLLSTQPPRATVILRPRT
jgi:YbbR domain-containing protein